MGHIVHIGHHRLKSCSTVITHGAGGRRSCGELRVEVGDTVKERRR